MGNGRVLKIGGTAALTMCLMVAAIGGQGGHGAWSSRAYGDDAGAVADGPAALDTLGLKGLQDKFQNISRKVAPAVVAISASMRVEDGAQAMRAGELNSDKLQKVLDRTTRVVGAGFAFAPDGYILTNEHVIAEAQSIWITTDDRRVYPAVVIGSDPRCDLAVLKVPVDLPTVRFAPYNSVQRGQWAIAMGNPYGLAADGGSCMSVGIVSALDRSLSKLARKENRLYLNMIQTTAQINPGNSGGPLFDLGGEVIGINTAVILPDRKANGIGFALTVTEAMMGVVHNLQEGCEISYGYLGVMAITATACQREAAGMKDEVGVCVEDVEADSPAAGMLKAGDMIVAVNGEVVRDGDQFVRMIGASSCGKAAKLSVYRGGKAALVAVTLGKRQCAVAGVTRENCRFHWRGLLLGPIPSNWEKRASKPAGGLMVLGISASSPFVKEHVAQGDVITAVAGRSVKDIAELQKIINDIPPQQCSLSVAGRTDAVVSMSGD